MGALRLGLASRIPGFRLASGVVRGGSAAGYRVELRLAASVGVGVGSGRRRCRHQGGVPSFGRADLSACCGRLCAGLSTGGQQGGSSGGLFRWGLVAEAVENVSAAALAPAWCAIVGAWVLFAVGVPFSLLLQLGAERVRGAISVPSFPKLFLGGVLFGGGGASMGSCDGSRVERHFGRLGPYCCRRCFFLGFFALFFWFSCSQPACCAGLCVCTGLWCFVCLRAWMLELH
jgi:hypothetical protein